MWNARFYRFLLLFPVLLLSGCSFETAKLRVGALVLVPFLLLIGVLWFLNRRPGDEDDDWDKQRFPDTDDDDDNEDHFLM